MSWEHWDEEKPCPCGKGKVRWHVKEDDWCHRETSLTAVDCDDCNRGRHLEHVYWYHKMDPCEGWFLVPDGMCLKDHVDVHGVDEEGREIEKASLRL